MKTETGYSWIILYLAQRKYKPTIAANTVAEFAPVSLAQGQIKACLLQASTFRMEPVLQPQQCTHDITLGETTVCCQRKHFQVLKKK